MIFMRASLAAKAASGRAASEFVSWCGWCLDLKVEKTQLLQTVFEDGNCIILYCEMIKSPDLRTSIAGTRGHSQLHVRRWVQRMGHEDGCFLFEFASKFSVSRGHLQNFNRITHVPRLYSECKRGPLIVGSNQRIHITHRWGDSWVYLIPLVKSYWSQILLYSN